MKMNKIFYKMIFSASVMLLALQHTLAGASGFIENMPELTKDADRPGAMMWQKPGLNRAEYTRVMIEPITIYISPDSKEKGLKADELKALSDAFLEALTDTLEPEIPVVNQPGPGVLYIRAALVDVKLAHKKRGLLGYTPVGFVVTAAANAAGGRIELKDAVLEVETLDSVSSERLGVLVDKHPNVGEKKEKELSWDSISKTFTFYADRFKQRMQAAQ